MAFNIVFLVLIAYGSTVMAFMTVNAILSIAVFLFACIRWPLLSVEDRGASPLIMVGLLIVSGGMLWYHYCQPRELPQTNGDT